MKGARRVIGKEQCKKLQSFIMNIDRVEKLDGLFKLTTARDAAIL
jgi:hypothetical protein